jgi:hypothetical protein
MKKTRKKPRKKPGKARRPKNARKKATKRKAGSKAAARAKSKRPARRSPAEPSSGSASSSLDPKRIGRLTVERPGAVSRRGRMAGDDQGISRNERGDSESVEELLEEGNTFEAEAVEGIESAPDADQGEVRTHEVPQDDVPGEYQDKDRF